MGPPDDLDDPDGGEDDGDDDDDDEGEETGKEKKTKKKKTKKKRRKRRRRGVTLGDVLDDMCMEYDDDDGSISRCLKQVGGGERKEKEIEWLVLT